MNEEDRVWLAELVARAQHGDRGAMNELLSDALSRAERMVSACTGYYEDTEDVLQEVAGCVFRNLKKLRDPARYPGWLARIVQGKAMELLRRKYREDGVRRREAGADLEELAGAGDRDDFLAPFYEDLLARVETELERLPPKYRRVLALRLIGNKTLPEIADLTGWPLNTVKTRVYRGLHRLKARLGESG